MSEAEAKQETLGGEASLNAEKAAWEKYTLTQLAKPLASPPWSQRDVAAAQCVLSLYHEFNPNIVVEGCNYDERDWGDVHTAWHEDACDYYSPGIRAFDGRTRSFAGWSHIGPPHTSAFRMAAEIVPYQNTRRKTVDLDRLVFGLRDDKLGDPANALLLPWRIKYWWHRHELFIVPVDPTEKPIKRWKCDAIAPAIKDCRISIGDWSICGADLEGMELTFHDDSDDRPGAHFLFLHFIISMMRIRDLKRPNWETVWAQHQSEPPFPTSEPYIRDKLLHALATCTYWTTPGLEVLATSFKGNCFDDDLYLDEFEVKEVARLLIKQADSQEEEHWEVRRNDPDESETLICTVPWGRSRLG